MLLTTLTLALAAPQETAAVGKVVDVGVAMPMTSREVIHNARIVVEGGQIVAVGKQSEIDVPAGYTHHRFPRSWAFPGGVDLHNHSQTGSWEDINDMVNPNNPELRVLDTVRPWNLQYRDASAGGGSQRVQMTFPATRRDGLSV